MSIMIKSAKFEHLSEKVITKLFKEVERRMSINGYDILLLCFVQFYEDFR